MSTRILIVEDEPFARDVLIDALQADGRTVVGKASVAEALGEVGRQPDIALVDYVLPGGTGFDVVDAFSRAGADTRFVMLTGMASVEHVISALRHGVHDYISKPYQLDDVLSAVERLESLVTLDRARATGASASTDVLQTAVPGMQAAYELARRAAPHAQPLLITGETGTGKTRLAKAVHAMSKRRDAPFVPVNCAALPDSLMESELFGTKRGAYTGAAQDRKGLVEIADGGTLFLDEIGEMSTSMQAKLLGVLEDGSVRRLGDHRQRPVNVRVIAATHVDLEAAVRAGTFRADLFFRLNVLRVHLLPLRHRQADLPLLVGRMLADLGATESELGGGELESLRDHAWEGNLRELRNVLERAVLLRDGHIRPSDFLASPTNLPLNAATEPQIRPLREVELDCIQRAVDAFGGNRERAAKALGTSVSTVRRRLLEDARSE